MQCNKWLKDSYQDDSDSQYRKHRIGETCYDASISYRVRL